MEDSSQKRTLEVKASGPALDLLASVGHHELQKCLFTDSLVAVSASGRELGEFCISVQKAGYNEEPCYLVHANSHGLIDGIPCGTSVMAYVSRTLETLEQKHHEYVMLKDHSLDRKSHIVRSEGQLVVNKVITEGEKVREDTSMFPLSSVQGFVSEAANLLIMRILALRKVLPENMVFLSFDSEMNMSSSTYRSLGSMQQMVGAEEADVFGIERTVETAGILRATWHCYFLCDGHLTNRAQVGSPVTMKLQKLPDLIGEELRDKEPILEKKPLIWEDDMQLYSTFLDQKEQLKADHVSYLKQHPELRALMLDFMQFLLLRKPSDVFSFASDYFAAFSSKHSTRETFTASQTATSENSAN
uniref:Ciliogenesis-associated TTC17-interacting protein n=2 Tax=Denticeps clupeoides TaxID=299321 RepID=A0AAY4AJ28_9TELE